MRGRILRGVAWQGSATVLARASRSLVWLVLGGILSPAEFGAFAAISVVVEGMYLLQELGLPQAIVVRRDRIAESADSAFVLAAALGAAFAAAGWILAPVVAGFYDAPGLVVPFRVLSLVLVAHSLRIVPLRLFERDLEFHRKVGPTAAGAIAYVVVAIGAALAGAGLWSLVAAVLTAAVVETAAFWIVSPWRPRWRLSADVMREDVRFGLPIVAAAVLAYAYVSLDRVVIGRLGDAGMLGAYAFALTIATVPSSAGSAIVNLVLLPSYRGLADDPHRRRELQFHAIALGTGFTLLFAALVLVLGGPFLQAAYGTKWDDAVGSLRILAFAGVARTAASLTGDFLIAAGRPGSYRTMNVLQLVIAAGAVLPAFRWRGAEGVALAVTVAPFASMLWGWRAASGPLGVAPIRYVHAVAPAVLAFVVAAVAARAAAGALAPPSGGASIAAWALAESALFLGAWWLMDPRLRRILPRGARDGGRG